MGDRFSSNGNNRDRIETVVDSRACTHGAKRPFKECKNLRGPIADCYYHVKDVIKAQENDEKGANHEIQFFFKYNAVDFEPKSKKQPAVNIYDDDEKGDNDMDSDDDVMSQGSALSEYQEYRFVR